MNETANVWSYSDTTASGDTAKTLADENTAVAVLTPSNPEGSVTFTEEVTASDTLANGQWYKASDGTAQTGDDNKEAGSSLQLTAGKNSKTLQIKASVSYLRQLGSTPKAISVAQTGNTSGSTAIVESSFAVGTSVTVIVAPHAVKMNNLKVTLKTANDSARDRYLQDANDVYDSLEARPTSVASGDIATTDTYSVALDGKRISEVSPIKMNLADATKDKTFKVETNAEVTYKSDDTNIATIDKDGFHAKAVGDTTLRITTKQSLTSYGTVEVTIPVHVVNMPAATISAPDDIYVHGTGVENSTVIGATGTNIQKNSIAYSFVFWNAATQDYVSSADGTWKKINPFRLDASKDTVYVEPYTGYDDSDYDWNAYLKVTATAAEGYDDPAPKYIRLHFDSSAPFELDAYNQELHTGESVQITAKSVKAVTGAAFTYKSYNPAVATVSETGVIKAVGEGSTKVDVTYGGNTQSVNVKVTNYENGSGSTATPAKVTGVTVTNVKGGKVKVTWDKDSEANVKYYVKKTVNGKSAGKSVGSNKTTLTVKKGATVKVKVKAYVYDESGKKLVGAHSSTVTKKTDRK